MIGALLSVSVLSVGCKTPIKLDNTRILINGNPQGFKDAVNSSPAGKSFVEATLDVIIGLEYEIEKGGIK